MTQSTIRVGIVGAGANTRSRHIPGLQAIEGVEIVSVANRSRASGEAVAQAFGIARVYDDWRALVEADDSDAIVIGTWPNMHCEVTLAALAAGKHVLTEARMAMDVEQARRMLAASRQHPRLVAQVVPSPFTLRVDATIRRLIDEGFLGQLYALRAPLGPAAFVDPNAPFTWRHDRATSGLNMMSLGIWIEAIMRWVGPAQKVCAVGRVWIDQRVDPQRGEAVACDIPDHLEVLAQLANGALLNMQIGAVTGLAPTPAIWLFGRDGTLMYDAANDTLHGGRRGEQALGEIAIPDHEADGWRVEAEFIDAIRGVAPVRLTTFEDGVRYMAFTQAVADSMAQGAWAKVWQDGA